MKPEVDAAIAQAWPERWQKANNPSLGGRSKARNNLRKQWKYKLEYDAFVAANPAARCGNCAHCSPAGIACKGLSCDLDTDFYGYQIVAADYVCARWMPTPEQERPGHG